MGLGRFGGGVGVTRYLCSRGARVLVTDREPAEKLADSVELSRSGLTERFTNVIGVPPMQYLIDWRMQLARSLLIGTQHSIADIAKRAGYDSAAGFRRRFKARQGAAPTQFRKRGAIARAR